MRLACCFRMDNEPTPMDIDSPPAEEEPKKYKKKNIPKAVRMAVWNTYIGETVGKTHCMVCNINAITQMNFHCAHVVAEALGGQTTVDNLRPTCAACNLSMGKQNLNEFKNAHFQ